MKNITLSAEENLIEQAREEARKRHTTLNSLFREWLKEFTTQDESRKRASAAIENLSKHLEFNRKISRDELNER